MYIKDADTKLDLSGCELLITTKAKTTSVQSLDDEFYLSCYSINESIDFGKAGVYTVEIERARLLCSFAVEVIDINEF